MEGSYTDVFRSLSTSVVADCLNVVLYSWQFDDGEYDTANHSHDSISNIIRNERYLSFTGNFFEQVVDLLFINLLLELGNGLMFSLEREPARYRTVIRYLGYGATVVLLSVGLAYFGQPTAAWAAYWAGSESNSAYAQLTSSLQTVGQVGAAFYIPAWAVSLFQVVYASFVMYKHRAGVLTRQVAMLYLAVAVLDFVRWTLFLVLYARYILGGADQPWGWNLVDALGNTWLRFAQLILLLAIGMRRKKGIWTTPQPWMGGSVSTMASTMHSAYASTSGPSPTLSPGALYQHALYHKEYLQTPVTPCYCAHALHHWPSQELPTAQHVVVSPRELDSMPYQYAPHPQLGPHYLVLQHQQSVHQAQQASQSQTQS